MRSTLAASRVRYDRHGSSGNGREGEMRLDDATALHVGTGLPLTMARRAQASASRASRIAPLPRAGMAAVGAAAVFVLVLSQNAAAEPITEFTIPTSDSNPLGITVGADGNLWLVENFGNKLGLFRARGVITVSGNMLTTLA